MTKELKLTDIIDFDDETFPDSYTIKNKYAIKETENYIHQDSLPYSSIICGFAMSDIHDFRNKTICEVELIGNSLKILRMTINLKSTF